MAAPSPDALLHLATLHILSTAGFPSTSRAASLTLSSIAAKYLRTVAQACTEQAALAGRSKVGTGDVVEVLEDMGQGVDELERWAVGRAEGEEGSFVGGLEMLGEHLKQGMELPDILAEMSLVNHADLPLDIEESEDDSMEEDEEGMEVDRDVTPGRVQTEAPAWTYVRSASPDFSWLPPLPGQSHAAPKDIDINPSDPLAPPLPVPSLPTSTQPKLSLIEKYRTRQSFSTSSLASSNFSDPPPHPSPHVAPPPTSSFPALLETYKAIAGEPSVSLAQTPLRMQAADLLRRVIAPPDMYGTSDTFSAPLPAPAGLVISASASDSLPQPTIPVNPNPTGILSRLVREMRSPYLPPTLRDRLTTLRPPLALNDQSGKPIFYGEPVRGPDAAALAKARGKPAGGADGMDVEQEAYYRYTRDAGPRGMDKWGKRELPSGKKVIKSVQGEDVPRTTAERPVTGIKLRLDRSPTTAQPPTPGGAPTSGGSGVEWEGQYGGPSGGFGEGRDKRQTSISLRIPSQTALNTLSDFGVSPGTNPNPTLRISTASLSPNPPAPSPSEGPAGLAPARTPRITLSPNPLTGRPSATSSVSPGNTGGVSPVPGPPTPGTAPAAGKIKLRLGGVKKET